jgi:membrane-associated phospholipid phosphatase
VATQGGIIAQAHTAGPRNTRPARWRRATLALTAWRHDPRFVPHVVLLLLFASAVFAFAHIIEDYLTGDPLVRWDVEFSRWLHVKSSSDLISLFGVITMAGSIAFLALLTVGVSFYLLRRRRLDQAALLCAAALGIEILNPLLKLLFHRPRPELAFIHLETYSFPSGHAAGASAIYAVAFYLIARPLRLRWHIFCAFTYVGVVGVIAFSRLYLEVHYLSDVLAGLSLGCAWAFGCLFAYEIRNDIALRVLPKRVRLLLARPAQSAENPPHNRSA